MALLVFTLILCKYLGAIAVFAIGSLLKLGLRTIRSSALIWLLLSAPTIYVVLCGYRENLSTGTMNSISSQTLDQERTGSLTFRLQNEELFVRKALW